MQLHFLVDCVLFRDTHETSRTPIRLNTYQLLGSGNKYANLVVKEMFIYLNYVVV